MVRTIKRKMKRGTPHEISRKAYEWLLKREAKPDGENS
jgi:hypothetical protein